MSSSSSNLPWVEKYRPNQLEELISHEDIIKTIQKFIEENRVPHFLFYGPPGTGKTSTILAVAKKLYSPNAFNSMVLELNASDDRGIGIVREQILSFASTRMIFKSGFKLVILDEADAMTNDAQNALRRDHENNARIGTAHIFECLVDATKRQSSRCTRFRFAPLNPLQMQPRLDFIVEKENVNVTPDGMKALITLGAGDMRKAVNILQSTSMAYDAVTEDNVYSCVGHPLEVDISNIVNWMLNHSITDAVSKISELKLGKGLALFDILSEVHRYIHRIDFPSSVKVYLLATMCDIEYRLSSGTNEKLQLSSLVAAFQVACDLVAKEGSN